MLRVPVFCLVLYLGGLSAWFFSSEPLFYFFLATYAVQRIPIVILLCMIVFNFTDEEEGPTLFSRIILMIGIGLYLINEIPITMWAYIIHKTSTAAPCLIGGFASLVDVIHLLFFISQILLFIFLRAEFLRNKEPCVWTIVSKRHEGYFDFREFEDDEQPSVSQPSNEYDQLFNSAKSSTKKF